MLPRARAAMVEVIRRVVRSNKVWLLSMVMLDLERVPASIQCGRRTPRGADDRQSGASRFFALVISVVVYALKRVYPLGLPVMNILQVRCRS